MKKVNDQREASQYRLILGLTCGLAISLCMLEYGKPFTKKYVWKGVSTEPITFIEPDIIPSIPIPKKTKTNVTVPTSKSTEMSIIPNEEFKTISNKEIPEIVPLIDFEPASDSIAAPVLATPPQPAFKLDVHPNCAALMNHLAENVKFPKRAYDLGLPGVVYVEFILKPNGELDQNSIEILKSDHRDFKREVLRVMKSAPICEPGYKNGIAVPTILQVPVRFNLK
ncbi:MAG: hypothetical protein Salg2KO_02110 [Salibacteraceae bacterium]